MWRLSLCYWFSMIWLYCGCSLDFDQFNLVNFSVNIQRDVTNPLIYINAEANTSAMIDQYSRFSNVIDCVEDETASSPSIDDLSSSILDKAVWSSSPGTPFLRVGIGDVPKPPVLNGNYQLDEKVSYLSDSLTVNDVRQISSDCIIVSGQLMNASASEEIYTYEFILESSTTAGSLFPRIRFFANITSFPSTSPFTSDVSSLIPRTFFYAATNRYESFHGFGESFTYFNLKGYRIPILVSEQGVGRGEEPITSYLNTNSSEGVGGHWYTTYAPKALYLTNLNHSVLIDESVIMFIDLSANDMVEIEVCSSHISGYIFHGESWLDLIESITAVIGHQRGLLPAWSQQGAIVGLEGGSVNVSLQVDKMISYGVPITGVWLQDWVGLRHSWDGDRLIWNWELNQDYYPGWSSMIDDWKQRDVRVLTYISPFFSNPENFSRSPHNFYEEGLLQGYFVKQADGSPYTMKSLSIDFNMLDVTNPSAVRWMIEIIKNYTFNQAQSSGFMCDFGEYLPFDAALSNGRSGAEYHNLYPQAWASIAYQALEEANQLDESLFFMRSAWLRSPAYVPVFWLGDQLISWDSNDGLASVITGALSSGLTGHAITHSDIGGYNTVTTYGSSMYYVRSAELLMRWSELAAFGSALYRTHIGSSTTPLNAQVYSSNASMAHFARFAYIFRNLSTYRTNLMQQAGSRGLPLMRPLALHYAYDSELWDMQGKYYENNFQSQYLFGEDFLIKPVISPSIDEVDVYLPAYSGTWIHLWSAREIDSASGRWIDAVSAGIGYPCVFYRSSSTYGHALREFVIEMGYDTEYVWTDAKDNKDDEDYSFWEHSWWILVLAFTVAIIIVMARHMYQKLNHRQAELRAMMNGESINQYARLTASLPEDGQP
jgi:sulfoquinovosidase